MIIPIIICAVGGTIVVRYLRKNRKDKDAGEGDSGKSGGSGSSGSAGDGSAGSGGSDDSPGSPGSGDSGDDSGGAGGAGSALNKEAPMTSIKSDNSAGAKASDTIGKTGEATGETIEASGETGNPEINRLFAINAATLAATDTKSPRLSRVERAKKLRDSKNPSRARRLSPSYEADQNPQRLKQHAPSHRKEKTLAK